MTKLAVHCSSCVAFAMQVLQKEHLANPDGPTLAVTSGNFHRSIEIDDKLPVQWIVPIVGIVAMGLSKCHARDRDATRQAAIATFFNPFDFDIPKMALAIVVSVKIINFGSSAESVGEFWLG